MSAPNDPSGMDIDLLKGSTRSLRSRVLLAQETWIFVAILVLGIIVSLISSKFATPGNLLNVFQNACFIGIMALGMTPVIISGGIDISVGSILGMCAVTLGIVLNADMPLIVGILVTLAVGIFCGAFNGAIIAYLNCRPSSSPWRPCRSAGVLRSSSPTTRCSTNSGSRLRPSLPSAVATPLAFPTWSTL